MEVKLNFVGVWAADFDPAFHFYTQVLGMESTRSSPGWAWFETRGMMFELFGGGSIDPQRAWGQRTDGPPGVESRGPGGSRG